MDADEIRRQLALHAAHRREHTEQAEAETLALRELARQGVAAGLPKRHVAAIAQISRPTLDAWLKD